MKRTLSIILITVILLSYCAIQPKAYTSVEIAYGLNLLRGTGSGLDEAYLSLSPTRSNAAMIILRLLGLENESLEFKQTDTFSDASSATGYWQPVLAYLYANPHIGFSGYGDNTFKPNDSINSQMLAKVLLTVLGYKQDTDFLWHNTLSFAESIGLKSLRDKSSITNSDVAIALVEALNIRTKEGYTLVTELVISDIIDINQAEKYGFIIENTEITIMSAKVTSTKTITFEFFMPIPANTSVVLRKDFTGISSTHELSLNRKKLIITTLATLTPGVYTVVVGGKVQNVTVETEVASSLVIEATRLYKATDQNIELKLLNQYGEAMSLKDVTVSATNKTSGTRKVTISKTESDAIIDASGANLGDQIYIYALDNKTLLYKSITLPVQSVPSIKRISVTDVVEASGNERIYENTSKHIIKIEAYDQYGQTYQIKQSDIDMGILIIVSTNGLCVSSSSIRADSAGNLLFTANTAGKTTISIFVVSEGISTSESIEVYQAPYLASMKVDQLPNTIFKNERVEVDIIGHDQYGNIYEIKSTDYISYTSSDQSVIPVSNILISNGVMSFYTLNSGYVSVDYRLGGNTYSLFDITVNDGNVPYIITDIDIPFVNFEKGITNYTIPLQAINVVDQFGNPNSLSERPVWDTVEWGIYIDRVSGNSFSFEDNIFSTTDISGTDVFNIYITRDGRIMDRSGYSFSLTNVDNTDIKVFDINTPETIYGGENNRIDEHTKYISIKGYTLANEPVMLKIDEKGLPTIISAITVSNDNIYIDTATWAIKFNAYFTQNDIVTIKFWKDGAEVKSVDILVLATESKVSRIEYDEYQSFIISSSEFYTEPLKIYDQYDIETNLPANIQWLSSSNYIDSVTFDPLTKRIRITVKGTVFVETEAIISYIPTDGLFSFRGFYTIMPGRY